MNKVIENYYKAANIPSNFLKQKMDKFKENSDIAYEFEFWIENGIYKAENPIIVEGYTAKSIAEISEFLDGEGAFMMLIELRTNPEKAKKQLETGFMMK